MKQSCLTSAGTVGTHTDPLGASRAPLDAQPAQLSANAAAFAPAPPIRLVVMVAPPGVPVRAHTTPVTVHVALSALAEAVESNAFVAAPDPSLATMQAVAVVVALDPVPVRAHVHPFGASPASQGAQAVQMVPDAAVAAPEPASAVVVVIPLSQVQVSAHSAPVSLHIAVQGALAAEVPSNPSVTTPAPLSAAVEAVVVVVSAVEVPVATHIVPTRASPLLEDAQPVQVSADVAGPAPEPPTRCVAMVALEQGLV